MRNAKESSETRADDQSLWEQRQPAMLPPAGRAARARGQPAEQSKGLLQSQRAGSGRIGAGVDEGDRGRCCELEVTMSSSSESGLSQPAISS